MLQPSSFLAAPSHQQPPAPCPLAHLRLETAGMHPKQQAEPRRAGVVGPVEGAVGRSEGAAWQAVLRRTISKGIVILLV